MELLIKIYSDQPSRFGIKYSYAYQAVKAYEALVSKYRGHTFSARLEPFGQKLSFMLESDQDGGKVYYKDLLYRAEQLKKLNEVLRPQMPIEFVHIYTEENQVLIAKPFRQRKFFSISRCSIIIP